MGVHAQPSPGPGLAPDALPGVEDVGAPALGPSDLALAGGLDFGHAGAVSGAGPDGYDRVGLDLGAALRVHEHVAIAWHTRGRTDLQGGGFGGLSARSELSARVATLELGGLRLGGATSLLIPATDNVPDMLSGVGLRVLGHAGFNPQPRLLLLAQLGFALDRAARSVPGLDDRAAVDRVSLGLSDSNALPLGLGAVYDLGPMKLLWEWSWELRVGRRAPAASQSTMWWRAGVRWPVPGGMALGLLAGLNSAARPSLQTPGAPHDIAPRFALSARLSLPFGQRAAARIAPPEAAAAPAAEASTPAKVDFETTLRGTRGEPLPGARVRLSRDGASREQVADAEGVVRFLRVPEGDWQLHAEAEGFEPTDTTLSLHPAAASPLAALQLAPALPEGQIRGTVRAFSGSPLRATIVIEPLGQRVRADPHGEFRVDVPPGQYTVTVSAPGYASQQRPAQVEEQGVTVLIVDLRRAR